MEHRKIGKDIRTLTDRRQIGTPKDWERYPNVDVTLKSLSNLKKEDITSDLFKELGSDRFAALHTYSMTRDPKSKAYDISRL
ncbi:21565_t:CDS:2 [Racocetra persica]|uniref:21565_t:CDS:1 n=1 Tax=Racocetra persica TaxID=160502 RepID=A0ACA9MWK3_9GLOM|nr:21565_t:CDS:2 [Racocetra persica]